ncbi:cupin domain-containing protein [Nocardioides terrisoli]|uniref:cupin domain-containing protein n=1 Tax=Nocardioides terrisoli TaxID=3388267 RepID=UPI00287BB7A6|nr:cupin domain-containing protein [Nocardioides marmorisolisilvae]
MPALNGTALDLLTGDAQTFIDKVWASRVHLHQVDRSALVDILALDDVDRLVTASGLRTPALRVVRDGQVCSSSEFTRQATIAGSPLTGLVDGRKALAMYDDGATLVLQGLHRYWPPLTQLVRELELALGHPCQANAYLTPPGSQGFARHSDTHDVFVFQTHGHKQWEIVEDDTARDIVMEPGLSMYLPTGTPHSARSQAESSLHVTIGVNRTTWRDLLRRRVDAVLADDRYDTPLPAGFIEDPDRLAGPLEAELAGLVDRLAALAADDVATLTAERFLRDRAPAMLGALGDRVRLPQLDDLTRLERRPTAACLLRDDGDRLRVLLGDRELRMPIRLRPAMEMVRDQASFVVGDLSACLDPQSRLVLCRRLVREGLLRFPR